MLPLNKQGCINENKSQDSARKELALYEQRLDTMNKNVEVSYHVISTQASPSNSVVDEHNLYASAFDEPIKKYSRLSSDYNSRSELYNRNRGDLEASE